MCNFCPPRAPPGRFQLQGAEIFLHCPEGLGHSKLTTAYFDRTLGTTSTLRNLKTVTQLLTLAESLAAKAATDAR